VLQVPQGKQKAIVTLSLLYWGVLMSSAF
jgi:hypothetical protein